MIELNGDIYLSPGEAGKETNKSRQTIYQNWKRWGWKPYHIGASLLFKKADIEKWLDNNLKPGTPPNNQRILVPDVESGV